MRTKGIHIAVGVMTGPLLTGMAGAAEQPMRQSPDVPYVHGDEAKLPNGVIGMSLQVGAERVGDPSVLYVGMMHPEGPAHQAGLRHGDEIVTVDGAAVSGKSYEQVVKMIRGEPSSVVKLGIKGEGGIQEFSITRMAGDKLPKGPMGSHGSPSK